MLDFNVEFISILYWITNNFNYYKRRIKMTLFKNFYPNAAAF